MEHALQMDRMYGPQRHIYDVTRRFYLLGRDALLEELPVRIGDAVLEVGCGTARNLLKLNAMRPGLTLCGLDASERMLATAQAKLKRAGTDGRIKLARKMGEDLDPLEDFSRRLPFDVVYFSYMLSMTGNWKEVLEAGWNALRVGGTLAVVDFWDQRGLPRWFAGMLSKWLELFGVRHRPELLEHLEAMHREGRAELRLDSVGRGYAYLAKLTKRQA
ncbi:class I SAM-dependent methyltransferase [Fundidesulfovibrio butyratiphilus]